MKIQVVSYITWKKDITGEYHLDQPINIDKFVESLGLLWNQDALVVVNNQIINEDYQLQDGDQVHLLLPILGG